ncbi:MAG: preprotein translocase subunit SecG [Dehalococcoidia bacterium]
MSLLNLIQILISSALIGVVLLQVKGQGMGGVFGGTSAGFRTRRGLEKTLFQATIGLIVLFVLISLLSVRFG